MAFPKSLLEERSARSEVLLGEMKARGVRFAQIEMPDPTGTVRGKITPIKKALAAGGSGISTLTVSPRSLDELPMTPFTSLENGFPKMVALPDYDTLIELPFKPGMASILADFYMDGGEPCPMDPRHMLKRAVAQLAERGLEARAAIEFECYVFHRDQDLINAGRFSELKPFGSTRDFYSITRAPHFEQLAVEFMTRMEDVGIPIEAFHTEYGIGMYEFIMGVSPVLQAADYATRAKLYFKQLCAEHGLMAVFMPKMGFRPEDNACGAHINLSLWEGGENRFWDKERGGISMLAEQFAAGLLSTAPALHAFFKPWVNSYRRMDRYAFSPENASWGLDNHSVALRVVHGNVPESQTRFEHRLAAPDVSFYLALSAVLLGGLYGVDSAAMPPPLAEGDASQDDRYEALPGNLAEATAALRNSGVARELFGEDFVEHFAVIRDDEWADYLQYCEANNVDPVAGPDAVTDWERAHYFEWN